MVLLRIWFSLYVHNSFFSLQVQLKLQRVAGCDITEQLPIQNPAKVCTLYIQTFAVCLGWNLFFNFAHWALKLTNSVEYGSSWEADSHASGQKHLSYYAMQRFITMFKISHYYVLFSTGLIQFTPSLYKIMGLVYWLKFCVSFLSPWCMLLALPSLLSFVLSVMLSVKTSLFCYMFSINCLVFILSGEAKWPCMPWKIRE
jgi:hypothetical protein